MLTASIENPDKNVSVHHEINPSLPAARSRMLGFAEDAQENRQLAEWAAVLGADIKIVSSGTSLLAALTPRLGNSNGDTDDTEQPFNLIVLGGQLPSWVYLDLIDRIKLRSVRPGLNNTGAKAPAVLLLLAPQTIGSIFDYISTHHLDLRVDFAERPTRSTEFCVRAKRLLQLEDVSFSYGISQRGDALNVNHPSFLSEFAGQPVTFGPYQLDFKRHSVSLHDEWIRLSYLEFALIWMLFSKIGKVVSKEDLLHSLFMHSGAKAADMNKRPLASYIGRIRHQLKFGPENGFSLEAVYGQGYVVRPA
jgi:DNA-binding response OmpR family regulator